MRLFPRGFRPLVLALSVRAFALADANLQSGTKGRHAAMKISTKVGSEGAAAVERQLQDFINKFDPENAALIRSVRKEFPPPMNWSTTTTTSLLLGILRLSGHPIPSSPSQAANGVGLSFYYGAKRRTPIKCCMTVGVDTGAFGGRCRGTGQDAVGCERRR